MSPGWPSISISFGAIDRDHYRLRDRRRFSESRAIGVINDNAFAVTVGLGKS
jgi:hypothetical protein